ncbi:formylglycine-generating enzyme family protein [Bacillus sp. sid0103]|nr:SUMF1/EgtB/PvdO family nonheme iron enzyme [Bacillus sp. sid0103]MBV7505528.1 formylglycine-generating enzyme family protein [Bacillus sp. sid0103]
METDSKEGFPADGEGPVRRVKVNPFLIYSYAVTNAEFDEFVKSKVYIQRRNSLGGRLFFIVSLSPNPSVQDQHVVTTHYTRDSSTGHLGFHCIADV